MQCEPGVEEPRIVQCDHKGLGEVKNTTIPYSYSAERKSISQINKFDSVSNRVQCLKIIEEVTEYEHSETASEVQCDQVPRPGNKT